MEKLEEILEWGGIKKDITCLIISAIALGMNIFNPVELPFDAAWISIILCGVPIIVEAIIGLVTAFDIKADVLVSIALIASIFIGENFAAGEVAFIMQLGALLEDLTVAKAHAGIEKLINLTPRTARIVEDNEEKIISAEQVNKGNIIRVLPGETIPADGIIIKGQTSIDQSVMTGESMPVDKAVAASYYENTGKKAGKPAEFKIIPGRGVSAQVDGNEVIAGNINFMNENNIKEFNDKDTRAYVEKGCTVIYIAVSGVYAGFIALADIMRDDTRKVIDKIKNIGVSAVLLTGDNKSAASQIAAQSGIDDFKAECMPEDKLTVIDKFEKQNMHVCMVGDGINDAPALRKATVGIAMGGIGSDIAVDAADIVFVRDDISSIPNLLALSKRMINTIKLNMTFSMALNFVAIILAITGVLNPVVGALVHNAGSIIVIINSAFLLKWRSKEYDI